MKKQRILSLLLALAMVFSLLPASAMAAKTEDFTDVSKDDWFYKYVDFVADRGYFVGTSDTTFSPEMSMTRAMFVVVLAALEGVKVNNNVSPFADVPANTWYSGAVKWAADNGVVAGVGDNKFAPDTAISREQMAVMMKAYVEWHSDKTGKIHKEKSHVDSFKDADKVASWAAKAVEDCRGWGLIAGAPDGNFYPQNTATRAEVATVIYNLAWMVLGGGGGGGGGHTCVDNNNDHKCDKCGDKISDCADANNDHKCDVCGEKVSDCADADNDHNCDICGEKVSDCADNDNDHKCDVCGETLSECEDADNDHKCDVCEAAMCPGEDLIFNAMVNSVKEIKAGLMEKGKLVTDATKLDEAALAVLDKIGALDLLSYGLENGEGYVYYGGTETFAEITAVNLTKNQCVVCAGGVDPHAIEVDTVLSLNKSTAKNIIDATGLTYELAVDAAKTLLAGAGYAVSAMTKEDAIAIAQTLADKFEAETGIAISKATVEKVVAKLQEVPEYVKDAADAAEADAVAVWNNNFKNDNGYVTGDVTFTVNDAEVVLKVDTETYLEVSKKDAVVALALAVAKDLYGDLKAATTWSTLPEITADDAFGFEATVEFSAADNDNAIKTDCFTYTYPVEFTFTAAGDAFDYVEYKYDGIHNVKVIVPQAVKDAYAAAANKLVEKALSLALSYKLGGLNFDLGYSTMALAADTDDITLPETNFDFNAMLDSAMGAWLNQNLTNGDMSNSALMDYINGTGSAEDLNHDALYEMIDSTLDQKIDELFGQLGEGYEPGDEIFVDLAKDPETLTDLMKDALGDNYTKLEDMGLTDYVVTKTQDYLDPEAIGNDGEKYTTPEVTEQMKENVANTVVDTIDKTLGNSSDPSAPAADPKVELYVKALNALTKISTVDGLADVELEYVAAALRNDTFQGYIAGRGDSVVDRVCDLVDYIPESASVSVGEYAVSAADLGAVRNATTTVAACDAIADLISIFGELKLSSFDNDGQVITVSVGGKSVSFGLAIDL